jgi:hypothetical protein
MKTTSSGHNTMRIISHRALASMAAALTILVLGFAAAPDLRAETPPDQIKAAGAIPLTTELLDKMEKCVKAVSADDAAKAELTAIGKDSSLSPETWGSTITAKCPKTVALFKTAGLTPDDFCKGIFAIMAVAMSEDLAKSTDKAVQANAAFVSANKDRANAVFGAFITLGEAPASPSTSPPTNPDN